MPNSISNDRFPLENQTPEQRAAFEEAEKVIKDVAGTSFRLKDEQGNLLGPFGPLSYTPTAFLPYLDYTRTYTTLSHLTHRERELAMLATASFTKAEYILYAHKKVAISIGFTEDQAERASQGIAPRDVTPRERFIYILALQFADSNGHVDDERFESAVAEIGREAIVQLAQMVGGCLLSSVLVNVGEVKVPEN